MIERKQAEEERSFLAAIVDSSDDAIIGKTLDGIITIWNRGAQELYGYSAEEAVGKPISILVPPEHPDEVPSSLERVWQGERVERYETVHVTRAGRRLDISLTVSPINDSEGNVVGASTIARNITERKEAERRLAAQHAVTRILAESATLGDATPRILQVLCESLRWEYGELWSLDRQACVPQRVRTWHVPSVDLTQFDEVARQHTFSRGVGLHGRVWESGEPAWIIDAAEDANFPRASVAAKAGLRGAVAFPILLGGEVLGVLGFYGQEIQEPDGEVLQMMSNIGSQIGQFMERKQAQEALRRSEERLRSIVTNAPVVLFALDCEGVFTLSEGKGLKALGLEPGQLVGLSAFEVYREVPRIVEAIRRALAGEEFSVIVETAGLIFETWFSPVLLGESGEVADVIGVAMDITQRKRAEEEHERLSRQSELILNSAGEGIFGLDRQGRTRFANPAAAAMLGYELEELIGRCQHDLIHHSHPDGSTYPREECPIYTALQDGAVHQINDEVFWRKDGTSFPIEYTSAPIHENGEVTGTVVIFSDITERKKAEEDLRRSEATLAEAQSIAHLGNWEWDAKTGQVWWSDETYRIYGLEPGVIAPTLDTVTEIFHPEDRHLLRRAIDQAFHQDKPYGFEHRIVRPDGMVRWVYRQVKVVRRQGEKSLRLIGTVQDITERKEAEEEKARQASRAALRSEVNAALAEGGTLQSMLQRCMESMVRRLGAAFARVWTLNEEEDVLELWASAGMYTHLDGPHSRVPVGQYKIGLIARERRPHLTNDVLGDPHVHDKEWAEQEGMVAFAGYPLVIEDRLVGVLAIFTRERLAEATINVLASVAGTMAQGIERKRAEENLRAYAARLNRSNRDLQDFAYVASHDLQEPLRKVRTFADRLDAKYGEVLGKQGRDYLERMEGAAARMQDLIDDLLTLSRVTTRAQPFTPVDLNEVAQDVVSDLEASIDQSGGRVEVSGLPTVEADRLQMRQLLQNLIGNAVKFHREKETPVVKVYGRLSQKRGGELSGGPAEGGVCQIIVEDNGIGFDEKYLERIFVPFQRLHGRAVYEGTGMGLAICRKVVERHDGDITARSAPGRGATFIVTLPFKKSERNPQEGWS